MRHKIPANIFDLLEQEFTLSRELLVMLDREQQAIVNMDMRELVGLSRRKAEQIATLKEVDEQLRRSVEEFTGKPSENAVRLSDLAAMTDGEEKKTLEKQRRELVALRQDIAAKSVINYNFVEDTKRHLHDAISLITRAAGEEQTGYGKPGHQQRPGASRPSLISREV
ncbi:flagellar protein FlgN [Desulfurivibrio alkaliphilus]|uniref:FlgN family protein n=1 Tax=Desulfurivibrio alkaliphilus (strain DSM 19089 / UNIQEM U267 / AHT2) TaxID=589865 RepID=D6Z724_DESAT|nr:flagellar protein FlgN [Desulfurivibrio alkaliphilus]ADH87011.1 FlgN family protein [Desulfurivibrio alkaliphilus AHT 2]